MILDIRHISKSFGTVAALSAVGFSMSDGETIALLGESGSGKSTLLRIICGLEIPDSGEVFLDGIKYNDDQVFVRPEHRNIGLVFQDNALFPHLSVVKNIGFGIKGSNKKDAIQQMVQITRLEGLENRLPHELSGGQQQRVAIGRALATQPQLLLMDEPFSTLDHSLKNEIRSEVRRIIHASGKPCILVTHQIDDATALADRIAVLEKGKLVQIGSSEELYETPSSLYVARLLGTVNEIDGKLVRAEHIEVGTGEKVASLEMQYFETANYVLQLNYKGKLLQALSQNPFTVGEQIPFTITKELLVGVK